MFREQGFEVVDAVVSAEERCAIEGELNSLRTAGVGMRNLLGRNWCASLAEKVRLCPGLAKLLPASHVAVQCTYFEKSQQKNWLVSLHQDLSVPVAARIDHPRLSGWSKKEGVIYVQPPLEVLENMVAVRVHLDPCGAKDGPLKVVPGSHVLGIIAAEAGLGVRRERQEVACLAARGASGRHATLDSARFFEINGAESPQGFALSLRAKRLALWSALANCGLTFHSRGQPTVASEFRR